MLIKNKVIELQLNSYHGIKINGKHALLKVKGMWRERDNFYLRAIVYLRAKDFHKSREEKSGDVSKTFLRNFSWLTHFMSLVFLQVSYQRFSAIFRGYRKRLVTCMRWVKKVTERCSIEFVEEKLLINQGTDIS